MGGNTFDGASIPPCCRYPEVFGCGLMGKGISPLVFGCSADVMDGISARTIRLGRACKSFFFGAHLCASRDTEPHVALTRTRVRTAAQS